LRRRQTGLEVDVELTDDQELFVETTRRFLETHAPMTSVRALFADPVGFDRGVWRQGAELGWTAMLVPEDLGGGSLSGQGLPDLALAAEELGRALHPGPFLPSNVVAFALAAYGSGEQHELLAGILSGEQIATWCMAGPAGVWSADAVDTQVSADGDGLVLSGTASFVQDAVNADVLLVTARGLGGLTQLVMRAATPGVTVAPLATLDLARRLDEVRFDGVRLPRSALLGDEGDADGAVERQLEVALVLQCAETVGLVDRVMEFTLQYAKDRVAFGRPIGSFQALKHRLADHAMWLEGSKATTCYAARAVQTRADDATLAVSVAKAHVAKTATAAIHDCVQIHGGIGMTWEHDIHLYLRRAVSNEVLYGTPQFHCQRLCDLAGV
jgi:alkylation response protein AidB-like acyl-CoA dehydrogenase